MIHLMASATLIICILFFPRSKEISRNPQLGWDHSHESSQSSQGTEVFDTLTSNISGTFAGDQSVMAPRKRHKLSPLAIHETTSTVELVFESYSATLLS